MAGDIPAAGGGEGGLLQSKMGPLPVWVWALIGLVAAWLYAKYRDSKNAAAQNSSANQGTNAADAESSQVAPQFVIENNMPTEASPSAPTPPATAGPPVVSTPVVTPPGTSGHPPVTGKPIPAKPPAKTSSPGKKPIVYRVQHNDTLTSIAASHGVKGGAQELWTFNTTPGNRPPATINTLKKRGPNLLYAGEEILIPQT